MAKKTKAILIHIATIGIMNGCTDMLTQASIYPEIAFNNTYGIKAITLGQFKASKLAYSKSGGCRSLTETCRAQATKFDPDNYGNVPHVNEACVAADNECGNYFIGPYLETSVFALPLRTTCHSEERTDSAIFTAGCFRHGPISYDNMAPAFHRRLSQSGLGASCSRSSCQFHCELEWCDKWYVISSFCPQCTHFSEMLTQIVAFQSTGDLLIARGGTMDQYSQAIASGVRLAFMYGDRDYT